MKKIKKLLVFLALTLTSTSCGSSDVIVNIYGVSEYNCTTDEIRILLSEKYIELYKKLIGKDFVPNVGDVKNRILTNLNEKSII